MNIKTPSIEKKYEIQHVSEDICSVCFSPNETELCSVGGKGFVVVLDLSSHTPKYELLGHGLSRVWSCDYSPSGKLIATGSEDKTIRMWSTDSANTDEKSEIIKIRQSETIFCVKFSHDGENLASSSYDKTVKIWNVERKECLETLGGDSGWVRGIDISPDDRTLVAGYDSGRVVRIWDLLSGKCVHSFHDHNNRVNCAKFHPKLYNCYLVSGSDDRSIKLYDLRKFRMLQSIEEHNLQVYDVSFHPSGKYLISASRDHTVIIFDFLKQKKLKKLYTLEEHKGTVCSVNFSRGGKYFASGSWSSVDSSRVILWRSNIFDRNETQSQMDLEERISFLTGGADGSKNNSMGGTYLKGGIVNFRLNQNKIFLFSKILLEK